MVEPLTENKPSSDSKVDPDFCRDCGMPCSNAEYHPYAACLMFRGCHDSELVRANLDSVIAHGYQMCCEEGYKGTMKP